MSIYVIGNKPELKEKYMCNVCKIYRLCIRDIHNNICICKVCFKKETKEKIACEYCNICGNMVFEKGDIIKTCSECDKETGNCCIGLSY